MNLNVYVKGATAVGTLAGMVLAGWFGLTANFAGKQEFEEFKVAATSADQRFLLQTERVQNEMRMDIIEDRIDRSGNSGDDPTKTRLERQLHRLEQRNLDIQRQLDQLN
jgi:hypothetical protein